jgi:tRNA (adenine57-N1/adenine58-N1)-methyltransferase
MRESGWIDIDMVEIAYKRFNVARERVGLSAPNERSSNPTPENVDEALQKLKQISQKTQVFNKMQSATASGNVSSAAEMELDTPPKSRDESRDPDGKDAEDGAGEEKPWMTGRLVHRTESEIKTHTSYLVFAALPREWSDEEEAAAMARWPCGNEMRTIGNVDKAARKQEKREMLFNQKKKRKQDT